MRNLIFLAFRKLTRRVTCTYTVHPSPGVHQSHGNTVNPTGLCNAAVVKRRASLKLRYVRLDLVNSPRLICYIFIY